MAAHATPTRSGPAAAATHPHEAAPTPAPDAERTPAQSRQWLSFLAGQGIHPKLTVSTPGDADEREADSVAERILAMTAPAAAPLAIGSASGSLARACCANCAGPEDDDMRLSRKAAGALPVARGAAQSAAAAVTRSGAALGSAERAYFEPRFGHDLSGVRIHTHSSAGRAARGIGALAYTHGQDIAFAPGQYRPGTPEGRRLLAHELVHTLQHSGGAPLLDGQAAPPGGLTIRRSPADTLYRQCPPPVMARGGAAGCGLCMGGNFGAIGALVHQLIQYAFFFSDPTLVPSGPGMEMIVPTVPEGDTPPFTPEVDLSRITDWHGLRVIEIGEIKPFDDAGTQAQEGLNKLDDYSRELRESGLFDEVRLLSAPPPAPFPFVEPTRPPDCPPQMIHVCQMAPGLYQYHCSPSWAEAQRNPACRCGRRRERERERVRDRVRVDVPVSPPVTVPDAPGVPEGYRPPVTVPDTPVAPPVRVPVPPVTVPEGPVSVPEGPVTVPEGPVSPPEGPVTAPEGPVSTPEGPVTTPEGPVSTPEGPIWFPGGPAANDNEDVGEEELQQAARVALAAAAAAAALWAIRQLPRGALRRVIAPLEAAAMAVLVVFYSQTAHAEIGPGESPLETLFDAMEQDGIPVDDELRARIEADPALKQALEGAARTGDLTEAQRAIAQRTMEIIAANPEEFTDEDLRILAEAMETASNSDPATQPTVETLRRAIEARRRGEPIGPIIDQGLQDAREGVSRDLGAAPPAPDAGGGETSPADPAEAAPEPLPIAEQYREQLAASHERERLFREMVGHQGGLPLTDAMIERFLATVPADLTAAQADALIARVITAEGATEDEIFARLEQAIAEVRADPAAEPGDAGTAPPPEGGEISTPPATPDPAPPAAEEPAPVPGPDAAPPGPATAPATPRRPAGLTPDQLAQLQRFIAGNPRPGVVSPLPPAEDRVAGHVFTRLVAMPDGNGSLVAAFMTMRITTVRSVNDFDVILSPATFYRANGVRRGVFPTHAETTTITPPPE